MPGQDELDKIAALSQKFNMADEVEKKTQGLNFPGLIVGRVVHYVAYGTPKGEFPQNAHRAAIVTDVENIEIGLVSLCVLNPTGMFFNQHLPFDGSGFPQLGTWHWPEKA